MFCKIVEEIVKSWSKCFVKSWSKCFIKWRVWATVFAWQILTWLNVILFLLNFYSCSDMHFVWFSMWDGFYSPRVSESHPSRWRRGWNSETSGEKSISLGKPYKMHFLAYFTVQGTLVMINTLRKVEDHENHVRWIYLTTVLYMGERQKYARMDCLLHLLAKIHN